jgi:hypothetical protein
VNEWGKYSILIKYTIFAGSFMGDIALPDVNYESEWSLKNNKSAQQEEIEKLKKEVYLDGLQVEEEGLTDILRKKIKQAPNHDDSLKNNNDKLLNEAMIVSNEIIFSTSSSLFFSSCLKRETLSFSFIDLCT